MSVFVILRYKMDDLSSRQMKHKAFQEKFMFIRISPSIIFLYNLTKYYPHLQLPSHEKVVLSNISAAGLPIISSVTLQQHGEIFVSKH